jgi:hypothetical protein
MRWLITMAIIAAALLTVYWTVIKPVTDLIEQRMQQIDRVLQQRA